MDVSSPKVMTVDASSEERLRALLKAGTVLAGELSLDALLSSVIDVARDITGAAYGALGVLDPTGSSLERFITAGIDDEVRARIGDLPTGRGILGALITERRPFRLHDLTLDPRSVGVPPGHPPMRTFLGVPITLRGAVYGNLYLTEKRGGEDFTAEDEDLAVLLAAQAAVAIENARYFEARGAWMRQLEDLANVSQVAGERLTPGDVLDGVCETALRIVDAETAIVLVKHGDALTAEAARGAAAAAVGSLPPARSDASKPGRVLARRRAERIDSAVDDPEIDQGVARALGLRTAAMVPLFVSDEPIGVLIVTNRRCADGRFSGTDLRLLEMIGHRAAHTIALSRRVSRELLERTLAAQETERRSLGRDLHDQIAQALALIQFGVRQLAGCDDHAERAEAADRLVELTESTLGEVRGLSHWLHPPALERSGLGAALRVLAERYETPDRTVRAEAILPERLPPEIETALFRVIQEAVANAVRHANAKSISVFVLREEGAVVALVEDDGAGFDPAATPADALGLVSMRERVEFLGGSFTLESAPGRGTTLRARVPVGRRRPS